MGPRLIVTAVTIGMLSFGFSWFGGGAKAKNEEKKEEVKQEVVQIESRMEETGEENTERLYETVVMDDEEKENLFPDLPPAIPNVARPAIPPRPATVSVPGRLPAGATLPDTRKFPDVPQVPRKKDILPDLPDVSPADVKVPVLPGRVMAMPEAAPDSSLPPQLDIPQAGQLKTVQNEQIQQIQTQLNSILKANQQFKNMQQEQLQEIQKITDQARIHRRILEDLERTRRNAGNLTEADAERILVEEQIRLIGQETQKSQQALSNVSKGVETVNR